MCRATCTFYIAVTLSLYTYSHTRTHTHIFMCTKMLTPSHTQIHTDTYRDNLIHTCTLTGTHTHIHSHILTHTVTHWHMNTQTHTHTQMYGLGWVAILPHCPSDNPCKWSWRRKSFLPSPGHHTEEIVLTLPLGSQCISHQAMQIMNHFLQLFKD